MNDEDIQVEYFVDDKPVVEQIKQQPSIMKGKTYMTFIMIGLCVIMFIIETLLGGSENSDVLVTLGAKVNYYIYQGQYWRLIAPLFLHIGLLHLVFNMYALFNIGPFIERIYGPVKFTVLYLLSGIMGCVFSFALGNLFGLSAGASGAIFGLMGSTLYFRKEYKEIFKKLIGSSIFFIIIINLIIGITTTGIDNLGHIGGLIGGYLSAEMLGLYQKNTFNSRKLIFGIIFILLIAAGIVIGNIRTSDLIIRNYV